MNARITNRDFPNRASGVAGGLWSRLVGRIRAWFAVPYGYQDEAGFHYGIQPAPPQRTKPAIRPPQSLDCANQAMQHPIAVPVAIETQPKPVIL